MKPVLIDTSALIALGNKGDAFHPQAVTVSEQLRQNQRTFLTTIAILLEFGNAFSALNLRAFAIKIIDTIYNSQKWACVAVDQTLFNQGYQKFKQMNDKEWGLVDCISMTVAEQFQITEIFTTDHHFKQAGFKILLTKTTIK